MSNENESRSQTAPELIARATHADIFSLGITRARHSFFVPDTDKWQTTIYSVWLPRKNELIFSDIQFKVDEYGELWSPQISKYLTSLTTSSIFERVLVLGKSAYRIDGKTKSTINDQLSYPLKSYIDLVNTITLTFDQELGVMIEEPQLLSGED